MVWDTCRKKREILPEGKYHPRSPSIATNKCWSTIPNSLSKNPDIQRDKTLLEKANRNSPLWTLHMELQGTDQNHYAYCVQEDKSQLKLLTGKWKL